jgi:hypothetical protein
MLSSYAPSRVDFTVADLYISNPQNDNLLF